MDRMRAALNKTVDENGQAGIGTKAVTKVRENGEQSE
jgi:hypothetical protein